MKSDEQNIISLEKVFNVTIAGLISFEDFHESAYFFFTFCFNDSFAFLIELSKMRFAYSRAYPLLHVCRNLLCWCLECLLNKLFSFAEIAKQVMIIELFISDEKWIINANGEREEDGKGRWKSGKTYCTASIFCYYNQTTRHNNHNNNCNNA